jgi:hypothetical protein
MAGDRVLGTSRVLLAMRQVPVTTEHELEGELDALGQLVARRMRALSVRRTAGFKPAGVGTLTNSIQSTAVEPLVREIGPHVDYAEFVERGVPAGGKGLPKFGTPESADILGWLRRAAYRGTRTPKKGSRAAVARELTLRDRYEGLAWHIRHYGVKASPFVKPALDELEPVIRVRLQAAAERAIAQTGSTA